VFGVRGLGFGLWGLGFEVWGLGFCVKYDTLTPPLFTRRCPVRHSLPYVRHAYSRSLPAAVRSVKGYLMSVTLTPALYPPPSGLSQPTLCMTHLLPLFTRRPLVCHSLPYVSHTYSRSLPLSSLTHACIHTYIHISIHSYKHTYA
jgi:hypothetical protein